MSARKDERSKQSLSSAGTHFHVMRSGEQLLLVKHAYVWRPPTDVREENGRLIVLVEIAGMQHGEFHVAVGPQRLTISGTRPRLDEGSAAYHQLEVRYGEFRTDVMLPWAVDEDNITARYDDGFLRVELPRAPEEESRVISVDKKGSEDN